MADAYLLSWQHENNLDLSAVIITIWGEKKVQMVLRRFLKKKKKLNTCAHAQKKKLIPLPIPDCNSLDIPIVYCCWFPRDI